MQFDIDINVKLNGEILIIDNAKEHNQYIPEDVDVVTSFDKYKYNDSATLNIITKINLSGNEFIKYSINDHTSSLDDAIFNINEDGYYIIKHIILPNKHWWNTASDDYKNYYDTIYILENDKVYKLINTEFIEISIETLLQEDFSKSTIKQCDVDLFFIGNLQQCYINRCKNILNDVLYECPTKSDDTQIRDILWMTINVLNYLIDFKQYEEAQRILENFNKCGRYCNPQKPKNKINCGCSKT